MMADNTASPNRFLILMRHAKSDWSDESLSDHDRPLNPRGQRDTPRMATWLAEVDLVPDMILSSSSVRTRETAALMTAQWLSEPKTLFRESLYLASPEGMLLAVQSEGGDAQRLMVLAHNPGMTHLVSDLSGQSIEMPTAAMAIFELAVSDWSELTPSVPMRLIHFMRPKAL